MVKLYIMSNDRPTIDGIIEVEPSYMDNDRVDYWPEGLLKGNEQGYGDMGGHYFHTSDYYVWTTNREIAEKIVEDANKYDLSWQQYKGDDLILYFYDWNKGGEELEITYENALEMTPEERAEVSSIDNIPEL